MPLLWYVACVHTLPGPGATNRACACVSVKRPSSVEASHANQWGEFGDDESGGSRWISIYLSGTSVVHGRKNHPSLTTMVVVVSHRPFRPPCIGVGVGVGVASSSSHATNRTNSLPWNIGPSPPTPCIPIPCLGVLVTDHITTGTIPPAPRARATPSSSSSIFSTIPSHVESSTFLPAVRVDGDESSPSRHGGGGFCPTDRNDRKDRDDGGRVGTSPITRFGPKVACCLRSLSHSPCLGH